MPHPVRMENDELRFFISNGKFQQIENCIPLFISLTTSSQMLTKINFDLKEFFHIYNLKPRLWIIKLQMDSNLRLAIEVFSFGQWDIESLNGR